MFLDLELFFGNNDLFLEFGDINLELLSAHFILNNHLLHLSFHDFEVRLADLCNRGNAELHLLNFGLVVLSRDFVLYDLSSETDDLLDVRSSGDANVLHFLLDLFLVFDLVDLTLNHFELKGLNVSFELGLGDESSTFDLLNGKFEFRLGELTNRDFGLEDLFNALGLFNGDLLLWFLLLLQFL